jgi:Uma2 family endonuclease
VQNSFLTRDSVPEPDLAVVRGEPLDYECRHPMALDTALLIEVADSSVDYDRQKLPIYARAGVPHVWIANLVEWQLECYSQPQSDGTFAETKTLKAVDLANLELPGYSHVQVPLSSVLNPPPVRI